MFDTLSEKLQRAFKNLRGQGTITEENIGEALREIRVALLEADVNLGVVKDLIEHIREKALGQEVVTALSPTEQVVKIVNDELTSLMGGEGAEIEFSPRPPTVILMAGLQGSGKTTATAKLARYLREQHKSSVAVAACDVYRPAAREHLHPLPVVLQIVVGRMLEESRRHAVGVDRRNATTGRSLSTPVNPAGATPMIVQGCDPISMTSPSAGRPPYRVCQNAHERTTTGAAAPTESSRVVKNRPATGWASKRSK